MNTFKRYDKAGRASFTETNEGYLLVDGIAVVPGLLTYRFKDGSKRVELIDSEEIQSSMDSLKLKPVTLLHPPEMIGPKTIKGLSIGTVGSVNSEDGALSVNFLIADAEAIKKAKDGMRDLSLGYSVKLDMTPGVHPIFGKYDARQYDREYNHLAIVPRARSTGSGFRLDSEDNLTQEGNMNIELLVSALGALSTDEVELTAELVSAGLSEEDAAVLAKSEVLRNEANKEAALELETKAVEKEEEALAASAAAQEQSLAKNDMQSELDKALSHDTLIAWHNKRLKLESLAKGIDISKMDNITASNAILKNSGISIDGKSDDYIEARIDGLSEVKPNSYEGFVRTPAKEATKQSGSSYLNFYRNQHKGSK